MSKLQDIRRDRGLSQAQLAKMAGICRHTLTNYEAGRSKSLHPSTVQKIAEALDVPLEDIDVWDNDNISKVKKLRLQSGMSIEQLATQTGVSKPTIINLENKRSKPWAVTLRKLAEALGVDPRDLET